jgi:hypothetical protein
VHAHHPTAPQTMDNDDAGIDAPDFIQPQQQSTMQKRQLKNELQLQWRV